MAKLSHIVFIFFACAAISASPAPNSYDLNIEEGMSLMERRFYPESIKVLEGAVNLDPRRPEAYYYLAIIYEREKDYDKAIPFWGKCYELAPEDKKGLEAKEHFIFLNIINERKKFLETIPLPEKLEKMHFIIYHNNYLYASKLVFRAEGGYKEILHDLGVVRLPFWDEFKCVLLLFPERGPYLSHMSAPEWSGGLAQYGRFLFATFENSPGLEENILPHELTHLALQMFMGSSAAIPLWLNEGLAKYEEESSKNYLQYMKENLKHNKFFPFTGLFAMADYPQDDISLFYAQSASIVYYLKENNISSFFPQFLAKIRAGVEINKALRDVYQWKFYNGAVDLEKKWREELR